MFVFKIITAIFWLAISLVWAENLCKPFINEPIFNFMIFFFAYGVSICVAIETLFAKVRFFNLLLFATIFIIMLAAGCNS